MIYGEEIVINGKVQKNIFEPFEVWSELGGFFQYRGFLAKSYELSVGLMKSSPKDVGEIITASPDQVIEELKKNEGAPVLSIAKKQDKGILDDHRIQFSSDRGFLDLYGRKSWFPNEWDSFFMTSNLGEKLVNVLIRPRSYIRSLRVYKTPPENDLLKAPGLTNDRGDYLEGVSAEMWFGESFWQYASCTKEDLKACDWLKCDDRNFQLHVEAWDGPFTSAEGEQGRVQRQLLKMLFGIGK